MSGRARASRTQIWLEGQGDWSWPGSGGAAAVELSPPSWVPALPMPLEVARAAPVLPQERTPRRALPRRFGSSALLTGLAIAAVALALDGRSSLERLVGASAAPHASFAEISRAPSVSVPSAPLPTLVRVGEDAAGSAIDSSAFDSVALHGEGSFLVYLPPGFASTSRRYPVLYLLHGTDQTDRSFLQIGLQSTLDQLIARNQMPPTIAVMIQGGSGTNNWLNHGARGYEAYVLEVQRLIDRTLPTIPERGARAIIGYSMGGYGAMHLALAHPSDFGVAESWLGFFNGLGGLVDSDRSQLRHMGLRAFLYGGGSDAIASPAEDAPFAAALRAAGADAHSAIYPGEHDFATLQAHLQSTLAFAGRALSEHEPASTDAPAQSEPR